MKLKLKLTLIASAAYFAMTLGAYAVSMSSETNGVPGGTISTPGSEAKGNPIPPPFRSSEIIIERGYPCLVNGVPTWCPYPYRYSYFGY
jgi:hypothetical protein